MEIHLNGILNICTNIRAFNVGTNSFCWIVSPVDGAAPWTRALCPCGRCRGFGGRSSGRTPSPPSPPAPAAPSPALCGAAGSWCWLGSAAAPPTWGIIVDEWFEVLTRIGTTYSANRPSTHTPSWATIRSLELLLPFPLSELFDWERSPLCLGSRSP